MKKCPKIHQRRLVRVVLLLFLISSIVWAGVLTLVPTDCARLSIAKRLSTASGRPVTLGKVHLGFLGGVCLNDVRIGAPGQAKEPWLVVKEAFIDVGLLQLLVGTIEPTRIEVVGLELRVFRRSDGSLELADLLGHDSTADARPQLDDVPTPERSNVELLVRDGRITVLDEVSGTRLAFKSVQGRAVCNGIQSRIQELSAELNGGRVNLALQIDRAGRWPSFEGEVRLQGVSLDSGMRALAYLSPVFAGMNSDLNGKLDLVLYLQGEGDSRESIARTATGHGRIDLDPLVLDGSKLLEQVGKVVEVAPRGRVGAVHADLTIRNGRVGSDNLTLDVSPTPLIFAGYTDFEGRVAYRLRTDGLTEKLPIQAREILKELAIEVDDLADVRFEGTLDALHVTVAGVAVDGPGSHDPRRDDRARLHEIGRRLRDRIRR